MFLGMDWNLVIFTVCVIEGFCLQIMIMMEVRSLHSVISNFRHYLPKYIRTKYKKRSFVKSSFP